MVSTTEGMLDGIHSNTTNLWPAVSLDLVFMVSTTSLEKRLVDTTTTSNNTDGSAASRVKDFLGSRWKLDAGLSSIGVVRDYHSRITRCFSKNTSVTDFVFDAATSGTWGSVRLYYKYIVLNISPSGIFPIGRTFPMWRVALLPQ